MKPQQALATESIVGTIVFTDDLGRSVRLPSIIDSVTPTGINAQMMLCHLFPEKMASLAMEVPPSDVSDYADANLEDLVELPETGTLLSSSGADIVSEEVVEISPGIMLDVGLPKEGLADKLNALQLETNIPYIFIDISFGNLPNAYRALGSLLGCESRAEALASYVESVMAEVKGVVDLQETAYKVFYAQRELGLSVTGGISLQLDAITYAGGIPIVEPYDYANKAVLVDMVGGSEIDWILFDDTDVLEPLLLGEGEAYVVWSEAISSSGAGFAASPALYHSWLGSMVFAQSIGLLWLVSVIWPTHCDFDMDVRAQEFYNLFYGLGLADDSASELVGEITEEEVSNDQ
jgi:iron complex transport system substrate-binding protein